MPRSNAGRPARRSAVMVSRATNAIMIDSVDAKAPEHPATLNRPKVVELILEIRSILIANRHRNVCPVSIVDGRSSPTLVIRGTAVSKELYHARTSACFGGLQRLGQSSAARYLCGISADEISQDRGAFFGSILGTLNHVLLVDILTGNG